MNESPCAVCTGARSPRTHPGNHVIAKAGIARRLPSKPGIDQIEPYTELIVVSRPIVSANKDARFGGPNILDDVVVRVAADVPLVRSQSASHADAVDESLVLVLSSGLLFLAWGLGIPGQGQGSEGESQAQ